MWPYRVFLTILCFGLCATSSVGANKLSARQPGERLCDYYFRALHPSLQQNEVELLARFNPAEINPQSFNLGTVSENVIQFQDARGVSYYLRIQGEGQDIRTEHFSAALHDWAGVTTPVLRKLSGAERDVVQKKLKQLEQDLGSDYPSWFGKRDMTVALKFPGEEGFSALRQWGARGALRQMVIRWELAPNTNPEERALYVPMELERSRKYEYSRDNLEALISDLRKIAPHYFANTTPQNLGDHLQAFALTGKPEELRGFAQLSSERVPATIRTELADAWALSFAMGTGDLNPGNWLLHNGHAIAIDLGTSYGRAFFEGTPTLHKQALVDPYGLYQTDTESQFIAQMTRDLSPGLRQKLSELTHDKIRDIARSVGQRPSDKVVRGIYQRVQRVLHNGELPP